MSELQTVEPQTDLTRRGVELTVRLVVVGLLVYWCFRIFRALLMPLIWGVVLAVALAPIYLRLEGVLSEISRVAEGAIPVTILDSPLMPIAGTS